MIHLYPKITENFMSFIFLHGFKFLFISFGQKGKNSKAKKLTQEVWNVITDPHNHRIEYQKIKGLYIHISIMRTIIHIRK